MNENKQLILCSLTFVASLYGMYGFIDYMAQNPKIIDWDSLILIAILLFIFIFLLSSIISLFGIIEVLYNSYLKRKDSVND